MGVELAGPERERRVAPPGRCRKQTTDSSGTAGIASKSSASAQRRARCAARSSLASISRPNPSVPRCFHDIQSFSARQRRVPSKLSL